MPVEKSPLILITEKEYLELKSEVGYWQAISKYSICPNCGKPYIPDESKEAEIIEVEVKAYKRKIIHCCMKKDCSCKGVPGIKILSLTARRLFRMTAKKNIMSCQCCWNLLYKKIDLPALATKQPTG